MKFGNMLFAVSLLIIVSCTNSTSPETENDYDIIWAKQNSPIFIDSCFIVQENEVLKIEAGVEVKFQSSIADSTNLIDFNYATLNVGMLLVNGQIKAIGTENDSIVFTNNEDTDQSKWGIILLNNNNNNIFNYCKIENSNQINNIIINNNLSDSLSFYGGISLFQSSATIENCKVVNNGTGIYCRDNSNPFITNNNISNNRRGISCWVNSSPFIKNNNFYNNDSFAITGTNSSPTINNNHFENNNIQILFKVSNPIIINNQFLNGGGGLFFSGSSNPIIVNNVIDTHGIGIGFQSDCNGLVLNNNVINNSTSGIDFRNNSNPIIANTIIWGNGEAFRFYEFDNPNNPEISYSLVQDSVLFQDFSNLGNNLLNTNPLFIDEGNSNYNLSSESPCINAGSTSFDEIPETDLNGDSRISGDSIDIGAYEFQ